jgi:predicted PurR-regulated permease PerM
MSRFRQGILLGIVLSVLIVVAIALNLSDERRRQLSARLEELRNALPGIEQLRQSAQQVATKARETGSNLGEQVQESASKLGQRTQEMVSAAQQTATSLGTNLQAKSSEFVDGLRD